MQSSSSQPVRVRVSDWVRVWVSVTVSFSVSVRVSVGVSVWRALNHFGGV